MIEILVKNNLINLLESKTFNEFLLDWIIKQRWSGLTGQTIESMKIIDYFIESEYENKILLLLINIETQFLNKSRNIKYIVSYIIIRKLDKNVVLKIKYNNEIYYLSDASKYLVYYQWILKNFMKKREMLFQKGSNLFYNYDINNINGIKVKDFSILGGGDTTNSVIRLELFDNKSIVLKEYKVLKKQRETDILKFLTKMKFRYSPMLYGNVNLKIDEKTFDIAIIMENIKSIGDGGTLFWDNLLKYLDNMVKGKILKDEVKIYEKLRNDSELINIIDRLTISIVNFHKIMENFNGKNEFFNSEDITFYGKFLNDLIKECKIKLANLDLIKVHKFLKNIYEELFVNEPKFHKLQLLRKNLNGMKKIVCHQDLHFAQMLTSKQEHNINFYLIDFEGDPQLKYDLKIAKDIVFRDIAPLITALYYIQFNALVEIDKKYNSKNHDYYSLFKRIYSYSYDNKDFLNNYDLKFYHIFNFSNNWNKFIREKIVSNYFQKYNLEFKDKINFTNNKSFIFNSIKLYTIDRAIRELKYELTHRINNIIIPLFILWENLRDI
ncbi:MAG: hypothetical protein ACTSWR_00430 [Candidatus Helarchaeota archaeon]